MADLTEHTVAIVSFEGAVKREIKRLREQLKQDEKLSEFKFQITASGRTHDGDIKLKYLISADDYSTDQVVGDSVSAVMDEFARRRGWKSLHSPKAIGYDKIPSDDSTEDDSEVPF